jgi:hypothetical protein
VTVIVALVIAALVVLVVAVVAAIGRGSEVNPTPAAGSRTPTAGSGSQTTPANGPTTGQGTGRTGGSGPAGSGPVGQATPPTGRATGAGPRASVLVGRWYSPIGAGITFSPDGTFETFGGCNTGTGRWQLTTDGALTLVVRSRTRLPCPLSPASDGVPAGDMLLNLLGRTTRVETTSLNGHQAIALIDHNGVELTRAARQAAAT